MPFTRVDRLALLLCPCYRIGGLGLFGTAFRAINHAFAAACFTCAATAVLTVGSSSVALVALQHSVSVAGLAYSHHALFCIRARFQVGELSCNFLIGHLMDT